MTMMIKALKIGLFSMFIDSDEVNMPFIIMESNNKTRPTVKAIKLDLFLFLNPIFFQLISSGSGALEIVRPFTGNKSF